MQDKPFSFLLNLDTFHFHVIEKGDEKVIEMRKVCATSMNPHRYFMEEMETPLLSGDSQYWVIENGEMMKVEKATDFLTWVDMAIAMF